MTNERSVRAVQEVAARLSLRAPQRAALEVLAETLEHLDLKKGTDVHAALLQVQQQHPDVLEFERAFPNLCFALATGVGKTRLMGAFIALLAEQRGIRHFLVLAPNLTIYRKLIADFTPGTPKYVFQGLSAFAVSPPVLITGDDYQDGRATMPGLFDTAPIVINVFNIAKINSEVRGGAKPRIKRLAEYLGQSYFDHLAGLPDLVLLMDEAHRYRASAGQAALNDLGPVLGLELTATPQVERGTRSEAFRNVVYRYPLAQALRDGLIKEPAVATRENFNAADYTEEQLERLKLDDAVRLHEYTKVALTTYAHERGGAAVKPFMLVIAQHVEHANTLKSLIQQDDFFEGRYRDRVITVESRQSGEEREENVERLLKVEDPAEPTEIVIHVNMLKEGWDVTNLYTVVPLRAANSRTLVEQSIGRGLRLPYGTRTGVPEVDRLTIVAHDRFREIIADAGRSDSLIRAGVVIGRDVPMSRPVSVEVPSRLEQALGTVQEPGPQQAPFGPVTGNAERQVAQATLRATTELGCTMQLAGSDAYHRPEVQQAVLAEVQKQFSADSAARLLSAPPPVSPERTREIVLEVLRLLPQYRIDIPHLVPVPAGPAEAGIHDFDLTLDIFPRPVAEQILIQDLSTGDRSRLATEGVAQEQDLRNYLIRGLVEQPDVDYARHADLLYKLAGQLVAHLHSYLTSQETERVLQYQGSVLAGHIHAQLRQHRWQGRTGKATFARHGLLPLNETRYMAESDQPLDLTRPLADLSQIRRVLYGGFRKCLYPLQRFDSDTERRFALLLEQDPAVLKWFKPASGQVRLSYQLEPGGRVRQYEPDFVVETDSARYLCETKGAGSVGDESVLLKLEAAKHWCLEANRLALNSEGLLWKTVMIPHDAVFEAATLAGLESRYGS